MSDATRDKYFRTHPLGTKAAEGTAVGGTIGGTLGAVVGGIAAIGANLFLPGVGLVVWGPIAGALAGAGAGGAVGGLVGRACLAGGFLRSGLKFMPRASREAAP